MPPHYETLGIEENASPREIKTAYRKFAMKYHPDKSSGNPEDFLRLQKSYEILGEASKKAKYDFELKLQKEKSKGLEAKIIVTEAKIFNLNPRIVETKIKIVESKMGSKN